MWWPINSRLLTLGAGAVSIVAYYLVKQYRKSCVLHEFALAHGCQPVQNGPRWSIGLFLNFLRHGKQNKILPFFLSIAETYGSTLYLNLIGTPFIFTRDPENVKAMLATQFEDFGVGQREVIFEPLLGKGGIFVSDGESWQHSRALVRPAFTKSQIADLNLFESHLQPLLESIPKGGATIDLAPIFFQLTGDVGFEFLFGEVGKNATPEELKLRQQALEALNYVQTQIGKLWNLGPQRHLFFWNKFARSCRTVHSHADHIIAKALENLNSSEKGPASDSQMSTSKHYVFLDELILSTNDPLRIRTELLNILIAARETTATALTIAFHILSQRQDILQKLRHEVDVLDGDLPTYETLRNMKYLRNFLNESLRLYPIVPANMRMALKTTTLPHGGGIDGKSPIVIPKGKQIGFHPYTMHRNREYYGEDAMEFRPERWDEDLRMGWHYLAFNGGPRTCPGQQFALTEISYVIVRFLQTFSRIESRDPEPIVEQVMITLSSKNGAKVALFE